MRRAAPTAAVVVAAAASSLAVAGASYALLTALPRPSNQDNTAVRILKALERRRGAGALVFVDGRRLRAQCRRTKRGSFVALNDGTRLLIRATRVRPLRRPQREPELVAVHADLSGSYALYAAELKVRIVRGGHAWIRSTRVRGRPAYRVRLSRRPPRVELIVDRRTLRPLEARYASRRVTGKATIRHSRGRGC